MPEHRITEIFDRGFAQHEAGRLREAAQLYREVLAIDSSHADSWHLLGLVEMGAGQAGLAIGHIVKAIELQPEVSAYHYNLGSALLASGKLTEAEACLREAMRLEPGDPDVPNLLGNVFQNLGRYEEAETQYRAALRLDGAHPDAHNNLGSLLTRTGSFEAAETHLRDAVRLQPESLEAHNNLAVTLSSLCRPQDAVTCLREALRLSPAHADLHYNLAAALLLGGRFEEGWREFEWRWRMSSFPGPAREFAQPMWRGENLAGRTLLLYAEQGFGDALQFCRYASSVAARAGGARIIVEAPGPLARLFLSLDGVAEIVAAGEPLPPFDLQCPLMSLPLMFKTTLETVPASIPYLAPDPMQVAVWQQRLAGLPGLRVGLVWAGEPREFNPAVHAVDRRRSIGLDRLSGFATLRGVSFVSLQKGRAADQLRSPPPGLTIHDWTAELSDFADTAALISGLDLVISVDTSVAHLAGALGKPVWLLNRFDTCWRWLLDRDDSPWYPSLRQFRQAHPGDWQSVLDLVRTELSLMAYCRI